jgi:fermentation-respiration switch protein FrsA (DUF1100 family)
MFSNEIKDNPNGLKSPRDISIPYHEVRITTKDNFKLYGWFLYQMSYETGNGAPIDKFPTIIYFHENAGNIGFRLPFSELLYKKLNAHILVVGYRGYGYSEGVPSESGIKLDAEAILNYVFKNENTEISKYIDKSNIYLFGRSLGGAVTLYIADKLKPNIRGIILENTFLSMGDMVDHLFPFLRHLKTILLRNKWLSKDLIKSLRYPILFFCSSHDELVPFKHMEELYNLAKLAVFKQKYIIQNGTHNDSWQRCIKDYIDQMKVFMSRCDELDEIKDRTDGEDVLLINGGSSINRQEDEFNLIEKKIE